MGFRYFDKKIPLLIIGSSGHAKVAIDIAEKMKQYKILGLIDVPELKDKLVYKYKVLGTERDIAQYIRKYRNLNIFIAIGNNYIRKEVYEKIKNYNYNVNYANLIHPDAVIGKNFQIGIGNIIMPGSIINADTKIGDFCIINTGAKVDHECCIGNFVSLAPNSVMGGNVTINDFSIISIGAVIKHGCTIEKNCLIGAGGIVLKNCESNYVYYGVPAVKQRAHNYGDKYL